MSPSSPAPASPLTTQVNSATLIMGVTSSGKSALLHTLAKYVWRRWKKITRYYTSDGGGFPAKIQELQALGVMQVFRLLTRDDPEGTLAFETCYRSCQGWWPRRIDPRTGEVEPGVEMVPPIAVRFSMSCPQGHLVKVVPAESLLTPGPCPTCKVMVTKQNMRVSRSVAPNAGFENVGAVCFDGLTSMLAWEMRELGRRAGKLELKGEEGAIGGKVRSGDLSFGGTTRSHVGFAQTRGEELVHLSLGIPNLVVPPIFTALTHEDVDDRSLSITGPKIAGRAKTDEAPQWFGNVLETAKIPAMDGTNAEQRIVYLSEFTDAYGRRHLCKNRAAPGTLPAYLADPPGGDADPVKAFTQVNLGLFFELLDSALQKGVELTREEIPDAPGMPEGIVESGGASVQPATPLIQPEGGTAAPQTLQAPRTMTASSAATVTAQAIPPAAPAAPAAPVAAAKKRAQAKKASPAAPPEAVPAIPATAGASSPALAQEPSGTVVVTQPVGVPVIPAGQTVPVAPNIPAPAAPVTAPTAVSRPVAPPAGRRPVPAAPTLRGPGVAGSPARPVAAVPRAPAAAPRPPAATPAPAAAPVAAATAPPTPPSTTTTT